MNANTNSASPLALPGSETDSTGRLSADPVDWEDRYQTGDTPWEKGEAAPPLTDFLARHSIRGRVLVPGCGTGHDVRALASQGASVVGLDLAEMAITLALSIPPAGNETYEQGDLFALPESWNGRFDWVVEHTCFCAIDPALRADYVRAIARVLKPGGHYFAILYMTPDAETGPPFGTSREEITRLFEPHFTFLEEWVPSRTFEGREGRELCQLRYKGVRL